MTGIPGQTIGPFFDFALRFPGDRELVPADHLDVVHLSGVVFDGHDDPIPDALVEIWQADPRGRVLTEPGSLHRDGRSFTGWGRSTTDETGRYTFTTVEPGSIADEAPYFAIAVFARGLLDRLVTRAYLPESRQLERDPVLAAVGSRRTTLIAERAGSDLRFDIRLQGTRETVFFDYRTRR